MKSKRLLQIIVAVPLLILCSPLLLVSAILIKLTSPGPVLYRGKRVGQAGRVFTMYKLRTLIPDSEGKIRGRLLAQSDSYITKVGRILRKLKIDETLQLVNVIKGDMNIIGSRPIRPIFYDYYMESIPGYEFKFKRKPGITGLAQVMGDYETPVDAKLRFEIFYNDHKNILLDLRVILLTAKLLVTNVITRKQKL